MKTHPEPEQLSAYLDGETEAAERAQIEAHLRTCSDCSATVNALRTTIAELHELPSPTPSEQDSWALRAAMTRARKRPSKRYQRWVVAAGSVAAVAIAVVVITQTGGTEKSTFEPTSARANAESSSLVSVENTNFDQASASALVTGQAVTGGTVNGTAGFGAAPSTAEGGSSDTTLGSKQGAAAIPGPKATLQPADSYVPKIQRCEDQIFENDTTAHTPLRYIVARFEKKPAFFLLYSVGSGKATRTELWVAAQSDCTILFFAQ